MSAWHCAVLCFMEKDSCVLSGSKAAIKSMFPRWALNCTLPCPWPVVFAARDGWGGQVRALQMPRGCQAWPHITSGLSLHAFVNPPLQSGGCRASVPDPGPCGADTSGFGGEETSQRGRGLLTLSGASKWCARAKWWDAGFRGGGCGVATFGGVVSEQAREGGEGADGPRGPHLGRGNGRVRAAAGGWPVWAPVAVAGREASVRTGAEF